jgi:phosphohistidine phosphatase
MTQLILVRHGAAAARAESNDDRERALTLEGRSAIAALAPHLVRFGPPDLSLCSPARRTLETMEILLRTLAWTGPPTQDERLYPGDYWPLLHRLRIIDPALERVLVVGHNPGIGELAAHLAGHRSPIHEFRAGAAAVFEFAERWPELATSSVELIAFHAP